MIAPQKNTYQWDALQATQHNIMKMLQARFDWACSWVVLKSTTPLTPPSTSLSRTQHFTNKKYKRSWILMHPQMLSLIATNTCLLMIAPQAKIYEKLQIGQTSKTVLKIDIRKGLKVLFLSHLCFGKKMSYCHSLIIVCRRRRRPVKFYVWSTFFIKYQSYCFQTSYTY